MIQNPGCLKFTLRALCGRANRHLSVIVPIVACFTVYPVLALAECTCPTVPNAQDALKKSTTAFIGSVQKVKKSAVKTGLNEVRFGVMRRLKGFEELPGEIVYIFTPISDDECGYPFSDGQDYVVFANGNPASLKTTRCSGTNFLDLLGDAEKNQLLGRETATDVVDLTPK